MPADIDEYALVSSTALPFMVMETCIASFGSAICRNSSSRSGARYGVFRFSSVQGMPNIPPHSGGRAGPPHSGHMLLKILFFSSSFDLPFYFGSQFASLIHKS